MKRLVHSYDSFLMKMRMSQASAFIFVEGKRNDRFIYDRISEIVCTQKNIKYELCMSSEILSNPSGGKSVLLQFYDYLNEKNVLIDKYKGKTTIAFFYLDKDVDDILVLIRTCEHICYTEYYELENHIFSSSNLILATAATLSVASSKLSFINNESIKKELARNWKEWVILCLFSSYHKLSSECGYHAVSKINNPPCSSYDETKFTSYKEILKNQLCVSQEEFDLKFNEIRNMVYELYERDEFDKVFKGKWYVYIYSEFIKNRLHSQNPNFHGFQDRLYSSLNTLLDFNGSWCSSFKEKLRLCLESF